MKSASRAFIAFALALMALPHLVAPVPVLDRRLSGVPEDEDSGSGNRHDRRRAEALQRKNA